MFSAGARRQVSSTYYSVTGENRDAYQRRLLVNCAGTDVLEYGCGLGSSAFILAERGARSVTGIDISPVAIERAAATARRRGIHGVEFHVMDAEQLDFPADSFGLVCGTGILHHLDLDQGLSELSRVLRPDGTAVFVEPLGHNPLINLYRRRTPEVRTPDEHPLLLSDFASAERHFRDITTRYFHLSTLAAVPFRNTRVFPGLVRALAATDRGVFRAVPWIRRYAWQVMIEFREPIRAT